MISQTLTIARTTFIEAVRQPIYFVLLMIAGAAIVMTTWSTGYTMGMSEVGEVSGDDKLLLDVSLATVFLCGTLLGAFTATSAVSREIENKTVLTVVSKPVARFVVVLGKYLGAAGAITVAVIQMVLFVWLGLRHGVMTTAGQDLDAPVLVFALSALGISLFVAVWGNFFYGWHFTQTASLLLLPLMAIAFVLVMMFSKKWELQSLLKDFKPQVAIACLTVLLSLWVMAAIAVAASTRLGQVMTIVTCLGAMLLGLMSSFLVGQRAYDNKPLARVRLADPERERFRAFAESGDEYILTLRSAPVRALNVGQSLWYGPIPNGSTMSHADFEPYAPPPGGNGGEAMLRQGTPPALVVTAWNVGELKLTLKNIGGTGVRISRPPQQDDYLFDRRTKVNPWALAIWGVIPNLQFFWLLDAVTQNQLIPVGHLAMLCIYAATQIVLFLSLAILLFQKRDVG
ncbi:MULTISPECIES: ABC transporter permease [unclassified Nostoc]|uniref:ABC transporter permease n=1 Tax=unclassified Nostoc TaxID=2593658 RepID=UPI001E63A4FC|nr:MULTISPECIES: ABC transporter permease [unclassified Nostoc]MCC5618903.1 ABC transporter permease [Nostoc sp. CHAB 5836]MCC5621593.1 ABC transporter permease [Nostoc sp. CHAB 5715]